MLKWIFEIVVCLFVVLFSAPDTTCKAVITCKAQGGEFAVPCDLKTCGEIYQAS